MIPGLPHPVLQTRAQAKLCQMLRNRFERQSGAMLRSMFSQVVIFLSFAVELKYRSQVTIK